MHGIVKNSQTHVSCMKTYAFEADNSEHEAHSVWIDIPLETYITMDETGKVLRSYQRALPYRSV